MGDKVQGLNYNSNFTRKEQLEHNACSVIQVIYMDYVVS